MSPRDVKKFLEQGREVGEVLSEISPVHIPVETAVKLMLEHNQHVVNLATAGAKGRYDEYIAIYDEYYPHLLTLSDSL